MGDEIRARAKSEYRWYTKQENIISGELIDEAGKNRNKRWQNG